MEVRSRTWLLGFAFRWGDRFRKAKPHQISRAAIFGNEFGRTEDASKVSPTVKPFQILLRNICAHKYGASAIFDVVSPCETLLSHALTPRLFAPYGAFRTIKAGAIGAASGLYSQE